MTPNYYKSLGMAPGAEAAEIRAKYRALMRFYHPDKNDNPRAQERAREITAAFAVLGDPAKRADYDAARTLDNEMRMEQSGFAAAQRPNPPMRNFGIASVALAAVLTLTFAMWPESDVMPVRPRSLDKVAATAKTSHVAPKPIAAPTKVAARVDEAAPGPPAANPHPPPVLPHVAAVAPPSSPALPDVSRQIAQVEAPKKVAVAAEAAAAAPGCRLGSPRADGACTDERQAQVERMATGFFNQSMHYADASKQQLLLSARDRLATSRAQCHSDECVTDAYLRQMRDTTAIMMGNAPSQ